LDSKNGLSVEIIDRSNYFLRSAAKMWILFASAVEGRRRHAAVTNETARIQPADIQVRKGQTPIVCLTAYDTPMARRTDAHCDLLLVGDSLAMVVYGLETTRGITLEIMIAHGQAVMRGSEKACVVVDLPQGSYETSAEQAVASAKRVMDETGCQAVKLEGGEEMADAVAAIVQAGIPVFGHIGLMPQKAENRGGFKIQGKDDKGARQVIRDAKAVETAGAFAIVIEGTIESVAREVTEAISIPTIGIGASPECDGQILVTPDMVGLFSDFTPKFVKQYADAGALIDDAIEAYAKDVRARRFPELKHCFGVGPTTKEAAE
jgi:3-methyl-2-oxobutanoate hydroxymethyltransferase